MSATRHKSWRSRHALIQSWAKKYIYRQALALARRRQRSVAELVQDLITEEYGRTRRSA